MKMPPEMFEALLKIMDAKINAERARNDWDGGLHEAIQLNELEKEFKEKLVDREED